MNENSELSSKDVHASPSNSAVCFFGFYIAAGYAVAFISATIYLTKLFDSFLLNISILTSVILLVLPLKKIAVWVMINGNDFKYMRDDQQRYIWFGFIAPLITGISVICFLLFAS